MSKISSSNMLRTRRRDNNVKPNRRDTRHSRLDRKSSRGMIYENEELRLRTININAEIERGQYDIKKLKRENEMLKKEIWCLRDEYEKLDKLLKDKQIDFSSSSTTCSSDSESCSSCTEEASDEVETTQNIQNDQKTTNIMMKNLHKEFDQLTVVPEESTGDNSDMNSSINENIIKPDQSYPTKAQTLPNQQQLKVNFFSPIQTSHSCDFLQQQVLGTNQQYPELISKSATDLVVKTDNHSFADSSRSTFSNGGNLEELLNDIETISNDILEITQVPPLGKPYKSELNVVLMPNPMPLIGFEKYKQQHESVQNSLESLKNLEPPPKTDDTPDNSEHNPFYFNPDGTNDMFNNRYVVESSGSSTAKPPEGSKTNLLELTSSELVSSENDVTSPGKSPKMSIRRKVSIHFKGKKDQRRSLFDKFLHVQPNGHKKTPSLESSKKSTDGEAKTPSSSESNKATTAGAKKGKSASNSPERGKHVHMKDTDKKTHKKHSCPNAANVGGKKSDSKAGGGKSRRSSIDRVNNRERSFSVCTERSGDHRLLYDEFERERTNSMSSCDTVRPARKMSSISNIPLNGKVPWCGCWGNGCM